MNKPVSLTLFFILLLVGSPEAQESRKNVTTIQLKNGLNLILIENHSSPMIASVVTVNAGSVNETREINGVSHMLEHLVFNGTTNRTQEQLYYDQDYYGIYNNAHTDRDYTNYIVLAEKDFIEIALDIQSDMLFHSIFPEDKFEKEKGIILNELARHSSDDSYWAGEFFNRKFFQDTPYNLTVLGTPSSIKHIKREQVIKYYQTYYKPNNMTALVMGDFEPDKMTALFEKYFGAVNPGKIPEPETYQLNPTIIGKTSLQKIKSNNTYLNLGFTAPNAGHKDFYAFDLLSKLLNLHLKEELNDRLKRKNVAKLLRTSASFDFYRSISTFSISGVLPPESDAEAVKKEITIYLNEFINRDFNENEIQGLLTSLDVNEQFLYEKPHYYGMMKGPWIASGGWEFAVSHIDRLAKVSIDQLKRVGKKYFSTPRFFTSLTIPGDKKPAFIQEEYYTSGAKEVKFTKESIFLTKSWKKDKISTSAQKTEDTTPLLRGNQAYAPSLQSGDKGDSIVSEISKVEKSVFENGLTLLINSNPDSEVFAIHLLAKNRTVLEPPGKEGITDFLHRLIARRTGTKDKKQFKDSLNSIGAALKTVDNPYIPYDDYYTSREFSYIRFETIDKFYKEAIYSFSDLVLNPSFLGEDIKDIKAEMLSLIRKENENPSKIAGNLLYEELFNKELFSRRINGTEKSISSITQQDLNKFYKYYFAPNNLIISVSTSVDKKLVLKNFEKYFKALPKVKVSALSSDEYPIISKAKSIQLSMNKNQSYIRLGALFKMSRDEEAGFRVLASILSQRLAQNLREKKGLAYSLGAGFSVRKNYGLFQIAVGTRAETLNDAEKGIYKEIEIMKKEKVSFTELQKLINLYNSRRLMRSLTRISQSYQMGLNEFYGRPFNYNETLLREVKKIDPETVQNLARKYLKQENMVKIIVE